MPSYRGWGLWGHPAMRIRGQPVECTRGLAPFGTGGTLRYHSADNEVAPGLFSAGVLVLRTPAAGLVDA
jgi:hypothetical protein